MVQMFNDWWPKREGTEKGAKADLMGLVIFVQGSTPNYLRGYSLDTYFSL